jgi:hypothetical protein
MKCFLQLETVRTSNVPQTLATTLILRDHAKL